MKSPSNTSLSPTYLVVDDHEGFRREVCRRLSALTEREILESSNGRDAIAVYEQHQPDWVVMDVEMPVMDGLAATRHIYERFPEARIVILTQFDSSEIREVAFAAGAAHFLTKDKLGELDAILQSPESPPPHDP